MVKDETIAQLLTVFQRYGYEGATLTRLSEATGLGRASLYHHFPKGKEEIAAVVLNYTNDWLATNIIAPLGDRERPGSLRIKEMTKKVNELYSCGQKPCILAVLMLGEANDIFHKQIGQALKLWIDTLAQVLLEAGSDEKTAHYRAEDAILQIQGSLILAQGLKDTKPFERVLARLPETLLNL